MYQIIHWYIQYILEHTSHQGRQSLQHSTSYDPDKHPSC